MTTGYPAVRDKCRDLGIVHDDWQQGLGRLILGKRADGKYAATVGGVVLSIPRQVGKTFTIGTIIVGLCLLFPGMTVLWTAHRTRTSNETFQKMKGMTARAKVKPFMLSPRSVNGEQEIRFRNGSRILFGAREAGFGRGFDEVDIEVFDEAQILTEKALEDMVAATNQSRHPAGALLFYMGTPPRPVDPGEVFSNKRQKALSNKSKDMVYVEISADPDADPDDRTQWAKANPSFPDRTPVESILRLRENVGSDESFLREGLGVWDDDGVFRVLSVGAWNAGEAPDPKHAPERLVDFAVEMDKDRAWCTIGAAGFRSDGKIHVEVFKRDRGTRWVAPALLALAEKLGRITVAIDGGGPAQSLIQPLEDAGLNVLTLTQAEVAKACGGLVDAVSAETGCEVAHGPDPLLLAAVRGAVPKPFRDGGFTFTRVKSDVDVTPLLAVTFARWLAITNQKAPEVWSIAEMVAQIKAERLQNDQEPTENQPPTGGSGFFKPL